MPIGEDFLINLAANLAYDLLAAGAARLKRLAVGDPARSALRASYEAGFRAMLEAVTPALDRDRQALVADIFHDFVREPAVADRLLDLVLAGAPLPDLTALAERFATHFDRDTLPVDFTRALDAFHQGLTASLVDEASRKDSPLFNQVNLGRVIALHALLHSQQHSLAEIRERLAWLEGRDSSSVYNIVIAQATGVAIGDGATVNQFPVEMRALLAEVLEAIKTPNADQFEMDTSTAATRETFQRWLATANSTFSIPSLNLTLPISEAWVRLRAMGPKESADQPKTVDEYLREYHEWHRLADTTRNDKTFEIEVAAKREARLAVIGGPGSGKSTLLRRLAYSLSLQGKLVLRVSLRAVSLRMNQGAGFEEAIMAVASDGFGGDAARLNKVLRQADFLLADGLDETDPNRSQIADRLKHWALGNEKRHVVVTTRPVGHNLSWFPDWEHVELLPLNQEDVKQYTETIFALRHPAEPDRGAGAAASFLAALQNSKTAAIAARNPQLLGFLIALRLADRDITGNRYRLLSGIVDISKTQASADRMWRQDVADLTADRILEDVGWLLLNQSGISEKEILRRISDLYAPQSGHAVLESEALAVRAIGFWEERGILERLSIGTHKAVTFVHLSLQDYAAANFLARLPSDKCAEWIQHKCTAAECREAILLAGGTERASSVVETLLQMDDASDLISTSVLLAAEVLSEAERPDCQMIQDVTNRLRPRLTSAIPSIAYEAGEKLRPLALVSPALIGPIASELQKSSQTWSKEIGCALGLTADPAQYVNESVLADVLPSASDTRMRRGRGSGMMLIHRTLVRDLIVQGATYLLRPDNPCDCVELVKAKYQQADYSSGAHDALTKVLAQRIGWKQVGELNRALYRVVETLSNLTLGEEAFARGLVILLEAILAASSNLGGHIVRSADPKRDSIARLYAMLEIDQSPADELAEIGRHGLTDALTEVMRGAILVAGLEPAQVHLDVQQTLNDLQKSQTEPSDALHTSGSLSLRFRDLISASEELHYRFKPDWRLATGGILQTDLLIQAIAHPSANVCWFAGELLWECCDRETIRVGLKHIVTQGSGHALALVAQIAPDLWPDEAALLVLDRLENNPTDDCAPLAEILPRICHASLREPSTDVLRTILKSKHPSLVEATLQASVKLGLDEGLGSEIRTCYEWWTNAGPQDPVGGGVIPPSPAAALLAHLSTRKQVTIDELRLAANARRSDVRKVAVESICGRMAETETLVDPLLSEVKQALLPSGIVDEFSRRFPSACRLHQAGILGLLESSDRNVQIAAIRALGDGWGDQETLGQVLHQLLNAEDVDIRDEAVNALRRLRGLKPTRRT